MNAIVELPGRTERALCLKHLDALLEATPDIGGALVSSVDGFEVAARLKPNLSPATLSAMTSSQLALGEAICGETAMGACLNVVIESEHGHVLMMNVPNRRSKMLLTVLCCDGVSLGGLLWPVRRCAEEIGKRIDECAV
jgi:predicted regulator of Ras-like GTPase activity (Roadblock/LC7/MglB family)